MQVTKRYHGLTNDFKDEHKTGYDGDDFTEQRNGLVQSKLSGFLGFDCQKGAGVILDANRDDHSNGAKC